MIEGKSLERLISFTDAIVAVAITLLILPITDFFGELNATNFTHELQTGRFGQMMVGFFISFFTIFSFWNSHRRLLATTEKINKWAAWFNMIWILAIIAIPATTDLIVNVSGFVVTFTYGVILLIGSLSAVMLRHSIHGRLHLSDMVTSNALIVCLILCAIWPTLGPNVFFLLLLTPLTKRQLAKAGH